MHFSLSAGADPNSNKNHSPESLLIAPPEFSVENSRGIFRPSGTISFDKAVLLITDAIGFANARQIVELLVDSTGLTGFPSPDTFQRFFAVAAWSNAARGGLRLVFVARAEMIDPQKFGVTAAANRGLLCEIFTTESEAHAWLDATKPEATEPRPTFLTK